MGQLDNVSIYGSVILFSDLCQVLSIRHFTAHDFRMSYMGKPHHHIKAWFVSYKGQIYALNAKGDLIESPRALGKIATESKGTQTHDEDSDGFLNIDEDEAYDHNSTES